ncbi:hypothetical protein HZ994_05175 [Akkermansiaceae bacterium]|nr:hypothetical protein HZ994_05175 [Akkermansiaceae bacterium]
MFPAFLTVLVITSPLTLWLFVIRRYCIRNGMAYTPGANWDTTMWIDWQEARELAALRGDRAMIRWCRLFLAIKLIFAVLGFLALAGRVALM